MITKHRIIDIINQLDKKKYSFENLLQWYIGTNDLSNPALDIDNISRIMIPIVISLFRKKYNILIEVTLKDSKYGFIISEIPSGNKICDDMDIYPVKYFTTWEESALMAIKYCIGEYLYK